jgi:hypothetical protein
VFFRKAILAPLQLCECIDKFDIEVRLAPAGPSADAGAIRLAIARTLLAFITPEMRQKLRFGKYFVLFNDFDFMSEQQWFGHMLSYKAVLGTLSIALCTHYYLALLYSHHLVMLQDSFPH